MKELELNHWYYQTIHEFPPRCIYFKIIENRSGFRPTGNFQELDWIYEYIVENEQGNKRILYNQEIIKELMERSDDYLDKR
jgi:hypothetical protein